MGWGIIKRKKLKGFGHHGASVGGTTQFEVFPKILARPKNAGPNTNPDAGTLQSYGSPVMEDEASSAAPASRAAAAAAPR